MEIAHQTVYLFDPFIKQNSVCPSYRKISKEDEINKRLEKLNH